MKNNNNSWIVIPVFNNFPHFKNVVEKTLKYSENIIVVDDSSNDCNVKNELSDLKNNVTVLTRKNNRGKGNALKSGIEKALDNNAEQIITLDGDGQHNPDDIANFAEFLNKKQKRILLGVRDLKKAPLLNQIGNKLSNFLIKLECSQTLPDSQCGFRVYPAELFKEKVFESEDYGFETEVIVYAASRGYEIQNVPVTVKYQIDEKKASSHFKIIIDTLKIAYLHFFLLSNQAIGRISVGRLNIRTVFILLLIFLISSVFIFNSFRQKSSLKMSAETLNGKTIELKSEKWLKNLKENNLNAGIKNAEKIISSFSPECPKRNILFLMKGMGFSSNLLTDELCSLDFIRWRDALIAEDLASKIANVNDIFSVLGKKIKIISPEKNKFPSPSLIQIWFRKQGTLPDIIRLFAEMTLQSQAEITVIGIPDSEGNLLHLFCEVCENGRYSIYDFAFNFKIKDIKAVELAENSEKLKNHWPEKLIKLFQKNHIYMLPAEISDYRQTNMLLHKRISPLIKKPFFGKNPLIRMKKYISSGNFNTEKTKFIFWKYPISCLYGMNIPPTWRIIEDDSAHNEKKRIKE